MVLVVTQCSHGGVSGDYETGQALLDTGAIPGSDITQVTIVAIPRPTYNYIPIFY